MRKTKSHEIATHLIKVMRSKILRDCERVLVVMWAPRGLLVSVQAGAGSHGSVLAFSRSLSSVRETKGAGILKKIAF